MVAHSAGSRSFEFAASLSTGSGSFRHGPAYRASLKAIYYLIWIRDSGFSFTYQAAAGWPHKLPELCLLLLLDNPLSVREPDLPQTRMFAQLINRDLGKLEEDGLYYVVWTLFTQWTQNGSLDFMCDADWALIEEALAWVETVIWDKERGLFGEYTADETPAHGSRVQPSYWGPPSGAQCCIWGLSMPNFIPLADRDAVHAAVIDAIIAKSDMHFVNGICSAMSAVDTWCYDENKLIALHQRLATETNTPGKYLPMGGAILDTFNLMDGSGKPIPHQTQSADGLFYIDFTHQGSVHLTQTT